MLQREVTWLFGAMRFILELWLVTNSYPGGRHASQKPSRKIKDFLDRIKQE